MRVQINLAAKDICYNALGVGVEGREERRREDGREVRKGRAEGGREGQ